MIQVDGQCDCQTYRPWSNKLSPLRNVKIIQTTSFLKQVLVLAIAVEGPMSKFEITFATITTKGLRSVIRKQQLKLRIYRANKQF